MALGNKVKSRREQLEMTQAALARAVGVSQEAIALLEKRDSKSSRNTAKLAKALQTTVEWLEGEPERGVSDSAPDYNVESAASIEGEVPIISWVQAGNWEEVMDLQHPTDTDYETVPRVGRGANVYALRIKGDSMTAPPGAPYSFPEGYIIHVDPMQSASEGDFIIAKVNGHNEATFKRLKSDGGRPYLAPLNPMHPAIFEEFKILGKVIGVSLKL